MLVLYLNLCDIYENVKNKKYTTNSKMTENTTNDPDGSWGEIVFFSCFQVQEGNLISNCMST